MRDVCYWYNIPRLIERNPAQHRSENIYSYENVVRTRTRTRQGFVIIFVVITWSFYNVFITLIGMMWNIIYSYENVVKNSKHVLIIIFVFIN